jgi:PAS domain S-box-containing protein
MTRTMNNMPDASKVDSPSSISKAAMRGLLAGFILVAILAGAISVFGVYSSRLIQHDLDQIVNEHSRHVELLRNMEQLAQHRTRLNYEILQTNDAFELDEKIQEFSAAAGQFILAREKLMGLKLSKDETRLMTQHGVLAFNVQQLLGQTIELYIAGKHAAANNLLLTRAIPLQMKLLAITSELIVYNQTKIEAIQRTTLKNNQQQQRILIIGGFLAILLTLVIGWRVWQIMNTMIGGLQDTQKSLASTIRTMEFQQVAMYEHTIISIADTEGKIISVNEKFCSISQYSPDELIDQDHKMLNSGYHTPEFFVSLWQTIECGKIWQGNIRNRRKDGSFYWVASTIVPFLNETGMPYQYVSIRTDITQLIEAEQLLRTQRDFSNAAINAQPGIFFMISAEGKFIQSNNYFSFISGFNPAEILQMKPTDMVPETDKELVADYLRICIEHGAAKFETNLLTKADILIPFMIQFVKIFLNDTQYLIGTGVDISELKKTETDLRAAKDDAEHANAAKSEFLSSMSHELRTPMNAILGFSQLMSLDDTLSISNHDYVHEILQAGDHLLLLINEVLDLTKVESGSIDLTLGPVDICSMVEECMSLVGTLADKRDIHLNFSCLPGATARADSMRLKQALLNLLSNAIKYNRDGGNVRLNVEQVEPGRLRILVSDSGHGIPENKMIELFQPFNRLGAENSAIEGTGIGLTITRKIVELMGGSVGVSSSIGAGSTFWIELPEEASNNSVDDENKKFENANATLADLNNLQHLVLYIEDNPSNIKLMAQILGHRKHIQLLTAHSPELGVELARTRKPHLILLDINLPGMDGYQILQAIKADITMKDTPVIAVTANAMPREIKRGIEAGFSSYLTKPIDIVQFNMQLDKYFHYKTENNNS